jgi:hypothetical protein
VIIKKGGRMNAKRYLETVKKHFTPFYKRIKGSMEKTWSFKRIAPLGTPLKLSNLLGGSKDHQAWLATTVPRSVSNWERVEVYQDYSW